MKDTDKLCCDFGALEQNHELFKKDLNVTRLYPEENLRLRVGASTKI